MTDYNRLQKEWEAVRAYWNRDDNISLSKHCEEMGVDYKRCITHNQPMRKLGTRAERNKFADDQLARFRTKALPIAERTATRRPSVQSNHTEASEETAASLSAKDEEIAELRRQKEDLAQKLQESIASLSARPAVGAVDPWETHFKSVYERKHREINEWKKKYNTLFNIVMEQDAPPDTISGWMEEVVEDLDADWFEKYKQLRRRPKFKVALPKADEEEMKFE
jgi:hypothetical protein